MFDKWHEVINSQETYDTIADAVYESAAVVIGWSDGIGDHFDIFMSYNPVQFGSLQGGMHSNTDLFVSIARHGAFGFELNGAWKSLEYITEKLGNYGEETNKGLYELINGVCKALEGVVREGN